MNPICRLSPFALVALAIVNLALPNALAFTIDMVTVGDPGNAADATGFGAVPYEYQIGKFEVTIGQYAGFLNAVAKTDNYQLYNAGMGNNPNIAGISRTGSSGSYIYSVIGPSGTTPAGANSPGDRPITHVSWFDVARFTNWVSNGQPTGAQEAATTENGSYSLNGATSGIAPAINATNPNTGSPPLYRIPTEDEWYKAAYYKGGSTNAGYWEYATQVTGTVPGNTIGNEPNQANYRLSQINYAVTQSSAFSSTQNYLTNVGAFTNSMSFYGTFDQSGNVYEWNDLTGAAGSSKGCRGGDWPGLASVMSSSQRYVNSTAFENYGTGFRLASPVAVPEPSTYAMAIAGIACGGFSMWRRRTRA